ncbi:hypothetical protein D5S17_30985 [Pseudonocardiaceae bacterium YIM PH 21723]|nr:hypothetical protein D5S17_30985 [Pseudonocardiaceae bacterium YIM PH 21723]
MSPQGGEPRQLADEAKLLFEAIAGKADPWLQKMAAETASGEHSPATCGWCPLCAVLAVLRGERPELAVKLAEQASGLLTTLRLLVDQQTSGGPAPQQRTEGAPAQPTTVERIKVDRE